MRADSPRVWRFEAIGTVWEIETPEPLSGLARLEIDELVAGFDRDWSRFRPDSLVSSLARGAGVVSAPPDTVEILETYAALSAATGGAVSPLVGASLESLGYDAEYTLVDRGARSAPHDWRERLAWTTERLLLTEAAVIDVGAIGKGRLVDLVLDVVRHWTDGDVVVDASGDLAVRGRPQRIGLEHPYDPRRAIGVVEVTDAALCASAANRRSWPSASGAERLHHVLDARTGHPVRTVAATWAIAPTALQADAISTALFFDGGAALAHEWGVEWVRMLSDGRVEYSPGSTAELFEHEPFPPRRTAELSV